mmetsp:Transcript_12123/g.32876  ORF Transcript_12123/g.32876 Transcript_12123/m.32876 type:complete len:360 (-) Transcript_12123:245-1324(-)
MGVCSSLTGTSTYGSTKASQKDVLDYLQDGKSLPRLMLSGRLTGREGQADFAAKPVLHSGPSPPRKLGPTVGFVCQKGVKKGMPIFHNQDDFMVARVGDTAAYGVFDGHGPKGELVSSLVASQLPEHLALGLRLRQGWPEAARGAFEKAQSECAARQKEGSLACDLSGTTATVLFDRRAAGRGAGRGRELLLAHVGDSRAVLGRQGVGEEKLTAVDLTVDHKASIEAEQARITAAGGVVRRGGAGDTNARVYVRNALHPGLAMSRSIGDLVAHSIGVSDEPDVSMLKAEETWRFVLLCSDGVWEFISSQEAVDIVGRRPPTEAQAAAEELALEARRRWTQEDPDVVDDITVICVFLAEK